MTIYLKIILFLFLICFKSQAFENPKIKIIWMVIRISSEKKSINDVLI